MCLLVVQFSLVQYQVGEIFDGVLVYVFHKVFDARFWDFKFCELVNGVFMYDSSYSHRDGYKGVGVPSIVLYGAIQRVVFGMFMCDGLFWESVMEVSEFDKLYCMIG